ncbi:MAG: alpha/beta hydrolase [Candidatus Obscuribacterales bacterium]|nr:alpha/beta hydrolase [Candidatus Obscuribacterales bacterium]
MNRKRYLLSLKLVVPTLIIYYVPLCPIVAMPVYNLMLFHPIMSGEFSSREIVGTPIENEFFESKNGQLLHAWYLRKKESKYVVLVSHGNAGNLTHRIALIATLLNCGVSVLIYDYQGYGRSEGSPSLEGICEDGEAACQWLIDKKEYKGNQIIVMGESLGTGVSCRLAQHRNLGGIILQSPFSSLCDLAKQKIFWLNQYPCWLFPLELDNEHVLTLSHAPLLIVHGKQDRLISFSHAAKIFAAAVNPKSLLELPDAGHNDIYDINYELYFKGLQKFLRDLPD